MRSARLVRRLCRFAAVGALLLPCLLHAQVAAVGNDPAPTEPPPSMTKMLMPSHGETLMGVFYLAGGAGPHPTAVLFHGFPGYEQNLDIAQALTRAGWNVLAMHYRGSWGVGGTYSFTHCAEDAETQVAFVMDPANAAKYRIDANRVVVLGHSMGGYMAAYAAAHNPRVRALVLVSAWDISGGYRALDDPARAKSIANAQKTIGAGDVAPLAHTSPEALATEIFEHRTELTLHAFVSAIGKRPVLEITSDDGLAKANDAFVAALRADGDTAVTAEHFATDHVYSGHRIALETSILRWLESLPK